MIYANDSKLVNVISRLAYLSYAAAVVFSDDFKAALEPLDSVELKQACDKVATHG